MCVRYFAGDDLHSNNNYLGILDQEGRRVFGRRLKNRLPDILEALEPFREELVSVAVESTFNWYWLVDGLNDAGYQVDLVNTAAVKTYEGRKHVNDRTDAFFLADLNRLGVLPTGYIYPRRQRAVRDLMRKRMSLVRHRSALILSIQNIQHREAGARMNSSQIKHDSIESITTGISNPNVIQSVHSTRNVIFSLSDEIEQIERMVLGQVRLTDEWKLLKTIWGIGDVLATVIMLETGPIHRFRSPGNYASYCRAVPADWVSNQKKKGQGNTKNGNQYLAWAFIEAAQYAIQHYERARRWYQRKAATTKKGSIVARKALAHKLARVSWHVVHDQEPFDPKRLFQS